MEIAHPRIKPDLANTRNELILAKNLNMNKLSVSSSAFREWWLSYWRTIYWRLQKDAIVMISWNGRKVPHHQIWWRIGLFKLFFALLRKESLSENKWDEISKWWHWQENDMIALTLFCRFLTVRRSMSRRERCERQEGMDFTMTRSQGFRFLRETSGRTRAG